MKRIVLMLCCILMLVPIACTASQEQEVPVVRLHEVTRSVFYAPQYVADALGFFDEEGIQVEITTSGGSEKAMTALLAGEADICLAGPETGVYILNEGKADHPVIVGQLTKRDGSFLISREQIDSFSWSDLIGKSVIGGRAGGINDGENCTIIDSIQFNLMAGAFEGGEGDYVTLFEPTATEFQNAQKGYIVANIGLESGEVPYTCYFVTDQMRSAKVVQSFLRAIHRAQIWIQTATDQEIAEAMQPYFPDTSLESLMIVAKSYRETDSWKTELTMEEADYQRLLDIMDFNGVLTGRPDFHELVDNETAANAQ